MTQQADYERQLAALTARVWNLEREVAALRASAGGASPAPPLPEPSLPPPVTAIPFRPVPVPPRAPAAPRPPAQSLESRIGSQLLNRVGIFAVLIGVAWFLKLAMDRNYIGPAVRIALGLVLAAGLFLWSERFRRQNYSAFAYTLKALATGIGYLSLWAAFGLYHLLPGPLVFAAMTALTVLNGVLAWRQNSELLAAYALAGGLATPALLSTGQNQELFLFSYLLLLDLGALVLVAFRPWRRLAAAALLGTAAYTAAWGFTYYAPDAFTLTLTFFALFCLLFAGAPFLLLRRPERPDSLLFAVGLAIANALIAAVQIFALLENPAHHDARPWAAAAFAAFYAALVYAVPIFVGRRWVRREAVALAPALADTHAGLAVCFALLAVALRFHGYGITLGWLVEALALVELARRWPRAAMRVYAFAGLVLAWLSTLLLEFFDAPLRPAAVLGNAHFATYIVALAVLAAAARISVRADRSHPPTAHPPAHPITDHPIAEWPLIAGFCVIGFSIIALLAVSVEIHHYYYCGATLLHDMCGPRYADQRDTYSGFVLSAWFMIYGAALMAAGFWRQSSFLRWQALVLLALSILKVFLVDARHLTQGYRVLSFLGLGVLLLAVSFAYQRDWLGLRGRGAATS